MPNVVKLHQACFISVFNKMKSALFQSCWYRSAIDGDAYLRILTIRRKQNLMCRNARAQSPFAEIRPGYQIDATSAAHADAIVPCHRHDDKMGGKGRIKPEQYGWSRCPYLPCRDGTARAPAPRIEWAHRWQYRTTKRHHQPKSSLLRLPEKSPAGNK